MSEFYTEQLVKQKATLQTMIKRAAIVAFVIMMLMFCLIISLAAFPLFLAACALAVFLWKRTYLEFEYLYCGGEIDIDKIMGMQKRKRVLSADVKGMDILAPVGSPELYRYKDLKVIDCSTNSENKAYEMITTKKGQKVRVIFEPKEEILKHMKMYDSRKIIL